MATEGAGLDPEGNLLVPITLEEVTEDWLAKALHLDLGKGTVTITSNISGGYLGNMLRVKYSKNHEQDERNDQKFVIKLLPEEKYARDLVISEKMDKSELGVYEKLLPEFIKEIPSLEPYICPTLYGKIQEEDSKRKIQYSSVLVLKDLTCEGYVSKQYKNHKISATETESAIDFFAKFHAAGPLVEMRKGKRLNELFDFFPEWYYPNENPNRNFVMHNWLATGFGFSRQFIENYIKNTNPLAYDEGKKLISELIDPLEPYAQKIMNFFLKAGQKHPTAIHGDLWQNNILFPEGSVTQIIIIDWQLLGYADPVFDLAWFLITALQNDLTRKNLEKYVKQYYDKIEVLYSQKNEVDLPVRRSWKNLWEAFSTFGLVYVYFMIISSGEILLKHPENVPKCFDALVFLHKEMKTTEFLLKNMK